MKCLKKLASIAVSAVMLISSVCFAVTPAAAAEVIPVYLNGKQLEFPANDAQPQIYQNRTYVPIRKTAEYLGLSINWNSKTETLTFSREGITIDHTMRSNIVYVSGNPLTFDTRSINVQNRTLMPIRMLGESIGATVDWDNEKRCVYIKTADYTETTTETTTAEPVQAKPQITSASLNKTSIAVGENVKVNISAKDATRVKLIDAQTQKELEVITEYGEGDDGTRIFEALLRGENETGDTAVKSIIAIAGNDKEFFESLSDTKTLSYAVTADKKSSKDDDDDDDEEETIKFDYLKSYKLDKSSYDEDDYAYLTVVTTKDVSKVRVTNSFSSGRAESSDYTDKNGERKFELKTRLSKKGTIYLYITLYIEGEGYEAVQQKVQTTVGKAGNSSKKTYDELEIVDIDVLNDTVYIGESAHALVYTSTDVAEVSIYDEDDKKVATSYYYYSKEDGKLVWNMSFEVKTSGRQKFTVFAYNNDDEKTSESFKLDGERYSKSDAVVLSVDQRTTNVKDGDTCKFNVMCTSGISRVVLADYRGRELGEESTSSKSSGNREFTVKGEISDVDEDYYIYGYDDHDDKQSTYKFRVIGSSSGDLEIISVDVLSSKVDIDDDVEVTIETSNNVEKLVIVDQDDNRVYKKTKPTKEKDDVYIWEASFSPEVKGRNTFTITIEDEDDNTEEYDFNVKVTD